MIWLLLGGVAIYLITRKKEQAADQMYNGSGSGNSSSPRSFEMQSLDLSASPLNLPANVLTPSASYVPSQEEIAQRDNALNLFVNNQVASRPFTRPGFPVYYDPNTTPKAPVTLYPGESWFWVAKAGFWNITKV